MKDGNEIEIYYRWCKLDKVHEYGVVCREQPQRHESTNSWIYWIWETKWGRHYFSRYARTKSRSLGYSLTLIRGMKKANLSKNIKR